MDTFLGATFVSAEIRIFLPAGDVIVVLGAARRLACVRVCVLSPCALSMRPGRLVLSFHFAPIEFAESQFTPHRRRAFL